MKLYIVHGYTANKNAHWFPWLVSQCEKHNIRAYSLEMPNSHAPHFEQWLRTLEQEIILDHDTILVGHSLGCISLLQYLQANKNVTSVVGVVFVSGFCQSVTGLSELDEFCVKALNFDFLKQQILYKAVVSARDDTIVPWQYSEHLAEKLGADFYLFNSGGHFLDREGFTHLPVAFELVLKIQRAILEKE
ncbi:RBBP9/YdeN family alpha/beta hydrolase [Spirabiliibacterium falconis]|uniref:RBBP9/YdeN family alpha/beta hydrolase n=1 Tax=Spirabiliibacterium falconis TaxID=572023 RepID=UPI001AAD9A24|nr:alpha/beta hydrolase [Spirabiliibacterium falconis]MBE2894213.1 serine hydrolase family protein [Spirabiliibacterium falconis]